MDLLDMEWKDYLDIIMRRKKLMLSVFLSVFLVGLIVIVFSRPVYETDCTLLVTDLTGSPEAFGDLTKGNFLPGLGGKATLINTNLEMIKKRPILLKTIEEANTLYKDKQVRQLTINQLRTGIQAKAIPDTNLITISYKNHDPVFAANIINIVARVFVAQNQLLNQSSFTSAKYFIEGQLAEQKNILQKAEETLQTYKQSANTVALETETVTQLQGLAQIEANKIDIETKIKGITAQKQELESKINDTAAQVNPFYTSWRQSLETIDRENTNLRAQLINVNSEIGRVNYKLNQLPPKETEMARAMRDKTLAGEIYTRLLERYNEVRINEASKMANLQLIEPPVVPTTPIEPNKMKMLFSTMFIGLFLSLGSALVKEKVEEVPRSTEELKEILPYEVLGQLPSQDNLDPLFLTTAPSSQISEAMNLLRVNLGYQMPADKKTQNILITSAAPGEGKTLIAANLAIAFAKLNKKVALVDLDFRRPQLHQSFEMTDQKGICDYLAREALIEDILHVDKASGVTIVTTGKIRPGQNESQVMRRVNELIKYLNGSYDLVIFDSGPIPYVAETLDFAKNVDGIIIVVDMKNTRRKPLGTLQNILKNKNIPIFGMVLNKLDPIGLNYGYYTY